MESMEKKLMRYWVGKNPRVKTATMEWVESKGTLTQKELANKYHIDEATITIHVRRLKELGMNVPYSISKTQLIPCIGCSTNLHGTYPKFAVAYIGKNSRGPSEPHIRGYLCVKCSKEFPALHNKNRNEILRASRTHLT